MTAPQLIANQANAQFSTGPATAEGKVRSSRNALRHGLTAKNPLLPEEDPEEYKQHCQSFFQRFAWREECERELIQRMADTEWRLRRIPYIEAALMDVGEFAALASIAIYEQRLQRTLEKTTAHLRSLQGARSKEEIKNGFVSSKPAPSKIFCGRCFTENDQKKVCEHCGSKNHLMTEEEFDLRHPANVDSDGNVLSDHLAAAGFAPQPAALSMALGQPEQQQTQPRQQSSDVARGSEPV